MAKTEDRSFPNGADSDRNNKITTNYDHDLSKASKARNNQRRDTDPMIEKEGFLGVDDIDRMRRRNINKWY